MENRVLVKMSFICMRMKNHFHIKGWAINLVLIQRPVGTRKWPMMLPPHSIAYSQGCSLATIILGDCNTLKKRRWRLRRQQTCNAFNEKKRTSSSAAYIWYISLLLFHDYHNKPNFPNFTFYAARKTRQLFFSTLCKESLLFDDAKEM